MAESFFDTFVRAIGECNARRGILGSEGVVYPPSDEHGYDATPKNAVVFGRMGCDGVHYAVLRTGSEISDNTPVIQIAPMDFSDPYSVLAETFLEYLAIACEVSRAEMEDVFASQRNGSGSLVDFLRQRFDQSRVWERDHDRSIERYRSMLELRE